MKRSEIIDILKYKYPYYTNLYKLKKSELLQILNQTCNNITLSNYKNSCYLDSLIIALFYQNNTTINRYFLNSKIRDYGIPELSSIAIKIQDELLQLKNSLYKDVKIYCTGLRQLFNMYYKIYKKSVNTRYETINFLSEQTDPTVVLEFFDIIYILPKTLKTYIKNYGARYKTQPKKNMKVGNTEKRDSINIININIDNLIDKDTVYLKTLIPSKKELSKLDINNLYNIDDERFNIKITETSVLSASFLYIDIDRLYTNYNGNVQKLNTSIIPAISIKLSGNKFRLYLKSLILHYGGASGGHYVCVYECDTIWYLYDDLSQKVKVLGSYDDIIGDVNITSNIKALIYV